ncbi:MAG: DUF5067 domain-containing protein [Microbacterium gubbeenense]
MRRNTPLLTGTLSAFAIGMLLLSGCTTTNEPTAEPEETAAVAETSEPETAIEVEPETAVATSFADNILTLEDRTITINDVKTIAVGEPGNEYGDTPVIAFWYDVTNLSGEDMDATTSWIMAFTAYQDNDPNTLNELNVGSLPDSQFLDTQMATIKEGGTVSNAVSYGLSDETTPVELVASDDLGMTEIGSATFTLN